MDFKSYVSSYLESCYENSIISESEIISLWNDHCENNCDSDSCIYSMSEIDELVSTEGKTATEIYDMFARDFNTSDDYFKFTISGIESFDYVSDQIDFDELAEYAINYGINNDDLLDPLKEFLYDEFVCSLSDEQKECYELFMPDFEQFIIDGELSDIDDFESVSEKLEEYFDYNEMTEYEELFK